MAYLFSAKRDTQRLNQQYISGLLYTDQRINDSISEGGIGGTLPNMTMVDWDVGVELDIATDTFTLPSSVRVGNADGIVYLGYYYNGSTFVRCYQKGVHFPIISSGNEVDDADATIPAGKNIVQVGKMSLDASELIIRPRQESFPAWTTQAKATELLFGGVAFRHVPSVLFNALVANPTDSVLTNVAGTELDKNVNANLIVPDQDGSGNLNATTGFIGQSGVSERLGSGFLATTEPWTYNPNIFNDAGFDAFGVTPQNALGLVTWANTLSKFSEANSYVNYIKTLNYSTGRGGGAISPNNRQLYMPLQENASGYFEPQDYLVELAVNNKTYWDIYRYPNSQNCYYVPGGFQSTSFDVLLEKSVERKHPERLKPAFLVCTLFMDDDFVSWQELGTIDQYRRGVTGVKAALRYYPPKIVLAI